VTWPKSVATRALPAVLHMANTATPSAIRPPNGVASGLRGNDLLLEACQHSLRLGEGQTQIADIGKIIGPVDPHDVGAPLITISPDLHQPYDPSHSAILSHRTDPVIPPDGAHNHSSTPSISSAPACPPTSEAVPKRQGGFAIPPGGQRKSTVAPALSTARYTYFQLPLTLT
jgi:hypothetical protein